MKQIVLISFTLLIFACQSQTEQQVENPKAKTENKVERYANGVKKLEGKIVDGKRHGIWKAYHENGNLWSVGKFRHGVREGISTVYYENGRKKMEGVYEKGLKIGIWKVWEDDGTFVQDIDLNSMLTKKDSLKLEW